MKCRYSDRLVTIISYLLIVLFTYAAVSKILEFHNFQAQLGQSPLLSAYTGFISYSVLSIEISIAILLSIDKIRKLALYGAFALMIMFTAYIFVILRFSSFVPCSCGGILEKLDWEQHLIFNAVITFLTGIIIIMNSFRKWYAAGYLCLIAILGTSVISILYAGSENEMHRKNPFIRRFIQGSAIKTASAELHSNSLYFAGSDGSIIYLGDNQAPLHILAFDTVLKTRKKYKISLERENFPFTSVQVRINAPFFYLMDGSVPVIYRGLIADWKGKVIMHSNGFYFSRAEIVDADRIAFRTQEIKTGNNILGTFTFGDSLSVAYAPKLLQKQIDGFFDTDGMMQYDAELKKLIYIYYYRNQFIVADKNLKLNYRGKTIDNTAKVDFKVSYIKETKQRKLASTATTVNQLTTTGHNLLFINSKLMGRYEPEEMWKLASIIDIYDIGKNTYKSSIYIYNDNQFKLREMVVVGNNLFAIVGHQIHKYSLSNNVISKEEKK